MVSVARRTLPPDVGVRLGDATRLPFRDAWFDRVTMSLVLHLLDRPRALVGGPTRRARRRANRDQHVSPGPLRLLLAQPVLSLDPGDRPGAVSNTRGDATASWRRPGSHDVSGGSLSPRERSGAKRPWRGFAGATSPRSISSRRRSSRRAQHEQNVSFRTPSASGSAGSSASATRGRSHPPALTNVTFVEPTRPALLDLECARLPAVCALRCRDGPVPDPSRRERDARHRRSIDGEENRRPCFPSSVSSRRPGPQL